MKQIAKWQAKDGREFKSEEECISYENLCYEIKILMLKLDPYPDSCKFSNGYGFIQQKENIFMEVRTKLLKISQRFTDHKWLQESVDKGLDADPSWAGRIIDECCPKPIRDAWYRIYCTTNDFREFGQVYYRNNPEKAKLICLNE